MVCFGVIFGSSQIEHIEHIERASTTMIKIKSIGLASKGGKM